MSDKEIAYDVKLEELFEDVKLQIWLNEELQIQPKQYHLLIRKNLTR